MFQEKLKPVNRTYSSDGYDKGEDKVLKHHRGSTRPTKNAPIARARSRPGEENPTSNYRKARASKSSRYLRFRGSNHKEGPQIPSTANEGTTNKATLVGETPLLSGNASLRRKVKISLEKATEATRTIHGVTSTVSDSHRPIQIDQRARTRTPSEEEEKRTEVKTTHA